MLNGIIDHVIKIHYFHVFSTLFTAFCILFIIIFYFKVSASDIHKVGARLNEAKFSYSVFYSFLTSQIIGCVCDMGRLAVGFALAEPFPGEL